MPTSGMGKKRCIEDDDGLIHFEKTAFLVKTSLDKTMTDLLIAVVYEAKMTR